MTTILFVCTGNTCRSPMAKALLLDCLKGHKGDYSLKDLKVLSAGMQTREGLPASAEAIEILALEKIDLSQHRSTMLSQELINQADYIITMSAGQCNTLRQSFPDVKTITTIRQFAAGESGDIVDPFGQGLEAYRQCMQEIKRLIPAITARIINAGGDKMKIIIGSDHAGVMLKHDIIEFLQNEGYDVLNCGTDSTESVDYPDIAEKVAQEVIKYQTPGILICGTGIGISIAANKITGIRAALCQNAFMARLARQHNDANILALGARVTGTGLALDIVKAFLESDFEAGRHQRRVGKICSLEKINERGR